MQHEWHPIIDIKMRLEMVHTLQQVCPCLRRLEAYTSECDVPFCVANDAEELPLERTHLLLLLLGLILVLWHLCTVLGLHYPHRIHVSLLEEANARENNDNKHQSTFIYHVKAQYVHRRSVLVCFPQIFRTDTHQIVSSSMSMAARGMPLSQLCERMHKLGYQFARLAQVQTA